ncbi:MAG: hypothetical protein P8P36_10005 [Akkermansiaceae bacterium]|nr:hypothetical protein [Akkermansiaceae bacterium]
MKPIFQTRSSCSMETGRAMPRAGNASSWQCLELAVGRGQWVAGSNANKKYYANQDNINKYFNSSQKQRSSWMRSGLSFALAIYFLCKGKLAC